MYVSGIVGLRGVAARYEQEAMATAAALGDRLAQADVYYNSAGYHMTIGELELALEQVTRALASYEVLGEQSGWCYAAALNGYLHYQLGRLDEAEDWYTRCRDAARRANDASNHSGSLSLLAAVHMRRGRVGEALQILGNFPSTAEAAPVVIRHGLCALARVHQGDTALAERLADEGLGLFDPAHVFAAAHAYEGYSAVAWTYLSLLSRATLEARPALLVKAKRACKALRRFARGSPIARPSAYLTLGVFAWLVQDQRRAKALWLKSMEAARARKMPFDEAHAHYLLGRCANLPKPDSSRHLARANELSKAFGVEEMETLTLPRVLRA